MKKFWAVKYISVVLFFLAVCFVTCKKKSNSTATASQTGGSSATTTSSGSSSTTGYSTGGYGHRQPSFIPNKQAKTRKIGPKEK